jgi:hypothetical protein
MTQTIADLHLLPFVMAFLFDADIDEGMFDSSSLIISPLLLLLLNRSARRSQNRRGRLGHSTRHVPSAFLRDFYSLPDPHFKRHFRMTRQSFQRLAEGLGPHLSNWRTGRKSLPVHERLAIALWRLGSNGSYRSVATLFNISKVPAWSITHSVSHVIFSTILDDFVRLPAGESKARIIAKFRRICSLDNVVRALGGCHISAVCRLPWLDARPYHSAQKLALTDGRGEAPPILPTASPAASSTTTANMSTIPPMVSPYRTKLSLHRLLLLLVASFLYKRDCLCHENGK